MSGAEQLALERCMPILEAEDELKGPVSDARLYDVVLMATGDEDAAWAARNERIRSRWRAGEQPEL